MGLNEPSMLNIFGDCEEKCGQKCASPSDLSGHKEKGTDIDNEGSGEKIQDEHKPKGCLFQ